MMVKRSHAFFSRATARTLQIAPVATNSKPRGSLRSVEEHTHVLQERHLSSDYKSAPGGGIHSCESSPSSHGCLQH